MTIIFAKCVLVVAVALLVGVLFWEEEKPPPEKIPPPAPKKFPQLKKNSPPAPKISLKKFRHPEFLQRAQERDIKYLVHFTRLENLPNIARQGLLSRKKLDAANENFVWNDISRLDNLRDSISLSVTFPNYKMFYRYQKISPDANWAIILLDAQKILAELDCAFNFANASSNRAKNIPVSQRMTLDAFDKMFYEPEGDSRFNRNLSDNEPTDPQAEILCFEAIPVKFFAQIVFENSSALQAAENNFAGVPCVVDRNYFAPRHDYSFWKKRQE